MSYYNDKKVLSVVSVEYLAPRGNIKLTENGSYDIRAYQKAVVSVFPSGTIQTITEEETAQAVGAFSNNILSKGTINYVGGMSQKINQFITNGDFAVNSRWSAYNQTNTSISIANNTLSQTFLSSGTGYNYGVMQTLTKQPVLNHVYLISLNINAPVVGQYGIDFDNSPTGKMFSVNSANAWEKHDIITEVVRGNTSNFILEPITGTTIPQDSVIRYKNVILADLTEIYGAGNEPTSTSDPRIPRLISLLKKYPQYNEGSIVNAKVTNLLSTDGTNESNYPIPAEVQALDGCGLGIDDTLYNYIDFERKRFVKKVGVVDLGTLTWTLVGNNVYVASTGCKKQAYQTIPNIKVSKDYEIIPVQYWSGGQINWSTDTRNMIMSVEYNNTRLMVRNTNVADAPALKTAMSGVMLVYELETPTETDISEYLDTTFTNENLITLYEDGKLYFENPNDMEVPYSLTYQERII